ncbi:AraC family transcriptional regulator [Tengunoibacter tsumagoiensis]|uniref:AraC family transcriptional regulator n=1 Tax=Tengunoibacter tsumagoiensis TaxID=2014871 RepID=A0A402A5J4_9CHLR|nr:AraC family transcriptional regulator [Tengunoibacter tsumagoiensis]GCE14291.1 AraC family transcriptional regulator [Tengunoibacter tsumagoiensis]
MSYSNVDLRETHIVGIRTREQIINSQLHPALTSYQIWLAGISSAFPPFQFVRHRPATNQFLVCLAGRGEVWYENEWRLCSAGMAYITPPHNFHAYRALDQEQAWKLCWINYSPSFHDHFMSAITAPLLLDVEPQELALAMEGLYHECMGAAEEIAIHHWIQLTHLYAQRLLGERARDNRLFSLWKKVDANLSHSWNNEELAAIVGVSSEHLRRLCQQQSGHSPMKHLTLLRMQRAMALLISDSNTIEAIAFRVGYENAFAFSTAFKRHVGMSPSQYRLRNQP